MYRASTQAVSVSALSVPRKGSWMRSDSGNTGTRVRRNPTELQRALTLIELQLAKGKVGCLTNKLFSIDTFE